MKSPDLSSDLFEDLADYLTGTITGHAVFTAPDITQPASEFSGSLKGILKDIDDFLEHLEIHIWMAHILKSYKLAVGILTVSDVVHNRYRSWL